MRSCSFLDFLARNSSNISSWCGEFASLHPRLALFKGGLNVPVKFFLQCSKLVGSFRKNSRLSASQAL